VATLGRAGLHGHRARGDPHDMVRLLKGHAVLYVKTLYQAENVKREDRGGGEL
jgi:hypothetical protein